jgi:hypothetical protein
MIPKIQTAEINHRRPETGMGAAMLKFPVRGTSRLFTLLSKSSKKSEPTTARPRQSHALNKFSINRLAEGDVRAHDAQLLKATAQQFSELTNRRSAQYRTLHRTRCKLNELMKRNLKDAPLR